MEKVSVYKCEDGQTFDNKAEAVAHQRELDIAAMGFDVENMMANADILFAFLKPYRTIKPRKASEAAE